MKQVIPVSEMPGEFIFSGFFISFLVILCFYFLNAFEQTRNKHYEFKRQKRLFP